MATPIQIDEDLIRGKAYFSDLNADNIKDLFNGCNCSCDNKLSVCLARIVKSLQYRVDQNVYDAITDTLYNQMMLIIGDYQVSPPTPVNYGINYGYSPIDYTGNYSAIPFQFTKQVALGSTSISLNYTTASVGNYLFFRVLTGQPVFNVWTIDIDENGVIPDIQWEAPVTFGLYDYYLSRQLIFLNPGSTTITYTGAVVPFQPITISLIKQTLATVTGPIEVSQESMKIFDLNLDGSQVLNRIIPKSMTFKNLTGSEVGVSVNGGDNLYLMIGQSYVLTDLNSTTPKTIVFEAQAGG